MGLFRRRRGEERQANDVLEEDAEMHETAGSSLLGPGALDFGGRRAFGLEPRRSRETAVDELRANADEEDDAAQEAFIESERRDEDGPQ